MWQIDGLWTLELILFVCQRALSENHAIKTKSRSTHRSLWLGLAPSTSSKSNFLACIMVSNLLWLLVCFAVHPISEISTTNFLPSAIVALALFLSFLSNSSMNFGNVDNSTMQKQLSFVVQCENCDRKTPVSFFDRYSSLLTFGSLRRL
jgi:hypothetical protein